MEQQIQGQTTIESSGSEQLNFFETINANLTGIAKLREDLKIVKEKLESEFAQHGSFVSAKDEAKKTREKLKEEKQIAMQSSVVSELTDEVKRIQDELKLKKEIQSDVLIAYADRSGQREINTDYGDRLIIKRSAKLVKPPKK
jgi:hypothetical protein